jgi:hypothetical protein
MKSALQWQYALSFDLLPKPGGGVKNKHVVEPLFTSVDASKNYDLVFEIYSAVPVPWCRPYSFNSANVKPKF